MAKTVAMSARDHGADIGDPDAVTGFLEDVQAGRVVLDEDLLERAVRRRGDEAMKRKFAQLPVRLPPAPELAAAAERSTVVGQLRAFTEWLGPDGWPLTAAGNIRPVDARELVVLLGTGDEGLRFRSATELPGPEPDRELGEEGSPGPQAGDAAGTGGEGTAFAGERRSPVAARLRLRVRPRRRCVPSVVGGCAAVAGAAPLQRDRART